MSESDIVQRLRELEAVESELACESDCPPEATANYRYAMTCAEAADEITRLRAEVEDLGHRLHHVHRLWANNEHAFRAENERLRAALRVYAGPVGGDNFPHWSDKYPGGVMVEWNTIDFGDAARAALGDTP